MIDVRVFALLLAVAAASAGALRTGAQIDLGGEERVSLSYAWEHTFLKPGERTHLGIVFDVAPGWHVQSGLGSGDEKPGSLPTVIKVALPEGWTAGEVLWPPAHEFTIGSGEFAMHASGYEGMVAALVPIDVPASAALGEIVATITVEYQVCDDSTCEMPAERTIRGAGEVVGAETENPPLDARLVPLFEETLSNNRPQDGAAPDMVFAPGERLKAKLAWYEGNVTPGAVAHLGVILTTAPTWHIQAGEGSGFESPGFIPTTIKVTLPEGWTAGQVIWPEAHAIITGSGEFALSANGYEGRTLAVIPVTAPAGATQGEHPVSVTVGYQACDPILCDPPTELTIVGRAVVPGANAAVPDESLDAATTRLFETVFARSGEAAAPPVDATSEAPSFDLGKWRWWIALAFVWMGMAWMILKTWGISTKPITRGLVVVSGLAVSYLGFAFVHGVTAESPFTWVHYSEAAFQQARADGKVVFVKFTADWCANCQVNERIIMASEDAVAELSRPYVVAMKVDFTGPNPEGDAAKAALGGGGIPLIAVFQPGREPQTIRGPIALDASDVISAMRGERTAADADTIVFDLLGWRFSVSTGATLVIFSLAFVAGFFMNFTPCVLPVIPIKILSLQAHAKNPRRCFFLGVIFGLGIIALYAVLGVLMAGVVTGIDRLDWGAQFSKWWVNAALGAVVFAMAVGMLGVFNIRLPQFLYMFNPQSDTAAGSFFLGVFTAVLSTPCTGPLLGATAAWVLTQTPGIAMLTLVIMGVGMAFPYVLLTAKPSWLSKLPRTGPGSNLVKQVMGLLLIAVGTFFILTGVKGLMVTLAQGA